MIWVKAALLPHFLFSDLGLVHSSPDTTHQYFNTSNHYTFHNNRQPSPGLKCLPVRSARHFIPHLVSQCVGFFSLSPSNKLSSPSLFILLHPPLSPSSLWYKRSINKHNPVYFIDVHFDPHFQPSYHSLCRWFSSQTFVSVVVHLHL